jgi:molybdopterin-guanine dinucleotide biosynthesis protein A
MGGSKATVGLHGRPLLTYPLEAMWRVFGHVVVIAKPNSELPSLPGVTVWLEPTTISHPLVGLRHALEMAETQPIVVCAGDLPFVTPRVVAQLAEGTHSAAAMVATAAGQTQPLLGWYHPRALAVLSQIDPESGVSVREAVGKLAPARLEVPPELLFNVNTPDDLLQAAAMMDVRRAAP